MGSVICEGEEGRKVSFHVSEVQDGVDLQLGDEVDFLIVRKQATGKCAALNVRRTRSVRRWFCAFAIPHKNIIC